jgi:hypothetical protein
MPVKYECPKCGRRFTEWGAEKVGFKCPADEWTTHDGEEETELVRVGASDEPGSKKPSLKRPTKKVQSVAVTPLLAEEGDITPEDDVEVEDEDEVEENDTEERDDSPLPLQGAAEDTSTGLSDDAGVEEKEDDEEELSKTSTLDEEALVDDGNNDEHWDE